MPRLLLVSLVGLILPSAIFAEERILNYHSEIRVQRDGELLVTETIRVRAEGKEINRGIYRDFPTRYHEAYVFAYTVPFEVQKVTRDGAREPYVLESVSNGTRVRIGHEDVFLKPGEYEYAITYRTDRQLGFFDQHDQLYWNVTGNGWAFPIDRASARVELPPGVPPDKIKVEAYTGETGAKDRNYEASTQHGISQFQTNKPLESHEGLTIVVDFPKGYVQEPTASERFWGLLVGNTALLVGLLAMAVLLSYYGYAWVNFGKDPPPESRRLRTEPPRDISPGAVRFVRNMGYDQSCLVATLYDLAVKGYVSIDQQDGDYVLKRLDDHAQGPLKSAQKTLFKRLFSGGKKLVLEQSNHSRISGAIDAFKKKLALEYESTYFVTNGKWFAGGLGLSLFLLVLLGLSPTQTEERFIAMFMMAWLSIWTLGVAMLFYAVCAAWSQVYSTPGVAAVGGAIFITLFSLPFFAGEVLGLVALLAAGSIWVGVFLLLIVGTNFLFYHLLKRPTEAGRRLLDQVDGFQQYLEGQQTGMHTGRDASLYERFVPYAVALGVESAWDQQFASILDAASVGTSSSYRPRWYHGHWDDDHFSGFSSQLAGSLSSSISSSSTAPGSSSGSSGGFSGGGSRGGGGGGGGGGGW